LNTESDEYNIDLDYRRDGKIFTNLIEQIEVENFIFMEANNGIEITMIQEALNTLYAIASEYAWLLNDHGIADLNKANKIVFSALHKNLIALHASFKLTKIGLYGPARSILRHVYEALLIAKFCSVSHNTDLYEKWKNGNDVRLSRNVLDKIIHPKTKAFREFWSLISDYSHASIYAQQVAVNIKNSPLHEISLNLVFLRTLIDCQYHLLGRHLITSSMQHHTKYYRQGADPVPAMKKKMNELLKESRTTLAKEPKEIIKNYRATWKLKGC
jgi:hypothetical protein